MIPRVDRGRSGPPCEEAASVEWNDGTTRVRAGDRARRARRHHAALAEGDEAAVVTLYRALRRPDRGRGAAGGAAAPGARRPRRRSTAWCSRSASSWRRSPTGGPPTAGRCRGSGPATGSPTSSTGPSARGPSRSTTAGSPTSTTAWSRWRRRSPTVRCSTPSTGWSLTWRAPGSSPRRSTGRPSAGATASSCSSTSTRSSAGTGSPATTVGSVFGLREVSVRQAARRARGRLLDLAANDEYFAPLAELPLLA